MRVLPLAAVPLLLLALPAHAQLLKSDIQKQDDKFVAAFNGGDAAAVAAIYTDNATVLPDGAPIVKGRSAIQRFWQNGITDGTKMVALTADHVESYGRAAREIGHFSMDVPSTQQQMTRAEGKYVVVWKKTPGAGWQIDSDIWNMNK